MLPHSMDPASPSQTLVTLDLESSNLTTASFAINNGNEFAETELFMERARVDTLSNDYQKLLSQNILLCQSLKQHKLITAKLQKENQVLKGHVRNLCSKFKSISQTHQQRDLQIEVLHDSRSREIELLKEALRTRDDDISALRRRCSELEKHLQGTQESLAVSQTNVEHLKAQKLDLESSLKTMESAHAQEIKDYQYQLQELRSRLSGAEDDILEEKRLNGKMHVQNEHLRSEVESRDSLICELKQRIEDLEATVQDATMQLSEHHSEIRRLNEVISQLEDDQESRIKQISQLETERETLLDKIVEMKQRHTRIHTLHKWRNATAKDSKRQWKKFALSRSHRHALREDTHLMKSCFLSWRSRSTTRRYLRTRWRTLTAFMLSSDRYESVLDAFISHTKHRQIMKVVKKTCEKITQTPTLLEPKPRAVTPPPLPMRVPVQTQSSQPVYTTHDSPAQKFDIGTQSPTRKPHSYRVAESESSVQQSSASLSLSASPSHPQLQHVRRVDVSIPSMRHHHHAGGRNCLACKVNANKSSQETSDSPMRRPPRPLQRSRSRSASYRTRPKSAPHASTVDDIMLLNPRESDGSERLQLAAALMPIVDEYRQALTDDIEHRVSKFVKNKRRHRR